MTTLKVEVSGSSGETLSVRVHIQDANSATCSVDVVHLESDFESSQHELSSEQIVQLTEALEDLSIPAAPEFAMGLDGHRTTLTIEQGFNSATYSWWVDPPEGWEDMGAYVKTILGLVSVEEVLERILLGP